jgi:ABC-type dipeptide/oligopeptide/nickel transport system ATPase component
MGVMKAVDGVDLEVGEGRTLGIVGESGSGKSVTALSILQLHDRGTTRMPSGSIQYRGEDLLRAKGAALRRIRGREIAMIFQDPMSSLNPVLTIADQISETLPAPGTDRGGCSKTCCRITRTRAHSRRATARR